ncbi:pheromone shutdown-related protein TraB [Halorientalis persicus]|jgi:pheromone shutdown-related protein TraB|uniref:Pheromone shutdown-related protein TraB n=1 Tax=Halorientalis persicus TaxID=1367881 RepID=A0A1H8R0L2_9EURY|nr:TraB/GumN family protein [Halorientalis persicus]SEO59777.1 pheromone shutdown-related protein TraB [Halorientalis persicus]
MSERSAPTPSDPSTPSGEGHVTVLGTAHVSEDSVREVEETIEEEQPDVVAVELDDGRYRQLKGETPDDLDPSDLLGGNTVFQFLAYWMLSYVQARLGDQFDVDPGADMMAAVDTAEEFGLGVALVDRDIQTTIQRFWARLTGLEKIKLLGGLVAGVADPIVAGMTFGFMLGVFLAIPLELLVGPLLLGGVGFVPGILVGVLDGLAIAVTITLAVGMPLALLLTGSSEEEDLEELDMSEMTNTDVVSAMMEEFRRFSPGGAEALIDERDAYIAHNLVELRDAGYSVVAVVGAGHRAGIEEYLDHPETLPAMESLIGVESGRRFSLFKLFGYLFTLGFLVIFALLVMAVATGVEGISTGLLIQIFGSWFLINGLIAFGLAKLAGAHWQSATVGGAVAWLTSLNPLLAPGWFAGYVELRYTSVNIGDINTLNEILDDEQAPVRDLFARMLDVPLFRLILIVAMTNIGSMIASALFGFVLLPYFFAEIGSTGEVVQLMARGAENSARLIWGLVA